VDDGFQAPDSIVFCAEECGVEDSNGWKFPPASDGGGAEDPAVSPVILIY